MPSLIDIRRRIRSVKNTQQITKAMKMVAAARLRKAQDRVIASRPYARMFGEVLRNVASAASGDERVSANPLLGIRPANKVQIVLMTADRGFAGAFNGNLIKATQQLMSEQKGECVLELYGRKGRDFFRRRQVNSSGEMTGISENPKFEHARALAATLTRRFVEEEVDAVYLVFNEFKSVLSQRVTVKKILPVVLDEQAGESPKDYIYEQDPAEMLESLLPQFIQNEIYQAMLEGAAAEHAARMTAMDAASSNAADVIDSLTMTMNRIRQSSITTGIIEVVSGAAALE